MNHHPSVIGRIPVSRFRHILPLAALLMCLVCARGVGGAERVDFPWRRLRDVNDAPIDLSESKFKVVCFLGVECPLARLYGPRLEELHDKFQADSVRMIGIDSNSQDSVDDIQSYLADHELSFPIVKDADQSLARRFGATRTPEVFVLDAADNVRYQGRIDDEFEPGLVRAAPTRHELRDALAALAAGRDVEVAKTDPAGCLITFVERTKQPLESSSAVTFTRDVAPILDRHCVECHRAGEIGPFALTDYDEVVGWGEMILEVIEQGRMPPWHADPRYGEFVGARRMPKQDQQTLAAWVAQGMPEGDPVDRPPPQAWTAGWHLSTPPDQQFVIRDRPFVVPREGTVEYQYFVVDPHWDEARWVRAAQVVPGNASVVHHAIVFVRPPDGEISKGIGWLGGYVPGQRSGALPAGHARRIPAGSKLVFQMHYTPNGRKTEDLTRVGVWFSDPDEVTHEVTTRVALNHHFEIPPGAKDHPVKLRLENFDRDARLLGAMPHMHLRGKSFRLDVKHGERRETVLLVPHYDFNWQHWYQFASPLPLDQIDSLEMEARFDNSAQNPTNPGPDRFVTWGDQTWEEMAVAFFDIAHPRGRPRVAAHRKPRLDPQQRAARRRSIRAEAEKFLRQLDKNGDGIVIADETPEVFRRFGFRRMDRNGDGRIDRDEIEVQAARRVGDADDR